MTTRKYDFNSLIIDIKTTCPEYYYQVNAQVLQNSGDRLSKAFDNFFNRVNLRKKGTNIKAGYPRFKSKIKSITYPQAKGAFRFITNKKLRVSKIGNIPIILHRMPKGKIKTLTIKVNNTNQWFAYLSCEVEDKKVVHSSKEKIGIDVGLESFITLSSGETVDNPRFLIKSEKRLKRLQRRLSRKKKGSANRRKARFRLAKQHIKVVNQRADFLHKLAHRITKSFSFIVVEDLKVNGMLHNHYLAKSINDASWNNFIQMLSYKAVTCGGQLVKVNPKGTSKTCSKCGAIMDMPPSRRKFKCSKCGFVCHRDLNASINIYGRAGLAQTSTPLDIV